MVVTTLFALLDIFIGLFCKLLFVQIVRGVKMYVRLREEWSRLQSGTTVIETELNEEGADIIQSLQVNLHAMGHHRPTHCTPLHSSAGMRTISIAFGSLKVMNELERLGFKLVSTDCMSVKSTELGDTRRCYYVVYMQRADIK